MLKIALIRLTGLAAQYAQMAKLDNKSFVEFKKGLISRFVPDDTRAAAVRQFAMCQQQVSESIQDFALRLRVLGERTLFPQESPDLEAQEMVRLEKELLERFTEGLLLTYRAHVLVPYPQSLQQAIDTACVIEKVEKQNPKPISILKTTDYPPLPSTTSSTESPDKATAVQFSNRSQSRDRQDEFGNLSLSPRRENPRDVTREFRSRSRDSDNRYRANDSSYRNRSPSAHRGRSSSAYHGSSPNAPYHQLSPQYGRNRPRSPYRQGTQRNDPRKRYQQRSSFTQWRAPQPGPANPCFTCGASNHWAAQCHMNRPQEQKQWTPRPLYSQVTSGNFGGPFRDQRGTPSRSYSPGRPGLGPRLNSSRIPRPIRH